MAVSHGFHTLAVRAAQLSVRAASFSCNWVSPAATSTASIHLSVGCELLAASAASNTVVRGCIASAKAATTATAKEAAASVLSVWRPLHGSNRSASKHSCCRLCGSADGQHLISHRCTSYCSSAKYSRTTSRLRDLAMLEGQFRLVLPQCCIAKQIPATSKQLLVAAPFGLP